MCSTQSLLTGNVYTLKYEGIKTLSDGSAEDPDYEVQGERMKVDHSPPVQNESQSNLSLATSTECYSSEHRQLKNYGLDCDKRFVFH